jgi:uncharacterized membrane protein YqjE
MGASPIPQRSLADVVQDILQNLQQIVHAEFRLARVELQEKAQAATKPAGTLATGVVLSLYGLGFLFLAAVYALDLVIPAWASALVVGGFLAIIGAILISGGRQKLKQINLVPEKTVETVKENVQWAKDQTK